MRWLTVKQKFAGIFALYIFMLLVLLCIIFFVIYQFLIKRQIDSALFKSNHFVISEFFLVENNQLKFKFDSSGKTLKEFLLSESLSAMVFDSSNNINKAYGVFALMDSEHRDWPKFSEAVLNKAALSKFETFDYPLPNGKMTLLSMQIKVKDSPYGVLVLGKSWEEFNQAKQTILLVTAILGCISLIGSYLLGYLLADYAFKPIGKIIKTVEKVDLEKLHKTIKLQGNPKDEITNLSNKINEMFSRLKQMTQKQKDFISHASHELKRPMTMAVSSLDVLALKQQHDGAKNIIQARNDLMEVSNLFDHILSLVPSSQNNLLKGNASLKEVIEKVVFQLDAELKSKSIKIINTVSTNREVRIPQSYLFIIVNNIISNAVKYSRQNSKIIISLKENEPLTLEIADHGIGMKDNEVTKIYDRFYRTNEARRVSMGHGLGMVIVKQICDLYKVKVSIQTKLGAGTKVALTF